MNSSSKYLEVIPSSAFLSDRFDIHWLIDYNMFNSLRPIGREEMSMDEYDPHLDRKRVAS
jgi:hypothetical protein